MSERTTDDLLVLACALVLLFILISSKTMSDPYSIEKHGKSAFSSSETIAELVKALATAQSELGPAIKNATNPHFRSDYADLSSHLETAMPILSKHKLALIQLPGYSGETITVTTVLAHESGEWIATTPGLKPDKGGPHELGSMITYLRRYGLGIYGASQADDDANEAAGKPAGTAAKQENPVDVMPMGKHKGVRYEDLPQDYLEWACDKMADGVPKNRCKEVLKARQERAA